MRNLIKGLILFVIIAGLSLLMPGLMDNTKYDVKADDAQWSGSGSSGAVDPFTVVEIVPYKGMDEIGYLVGGQEPINQDLMDISSANGQLSFLGDAINVYGSYEEKSSAAFGTASTGWNAFKEATIQSGYFEYVGSGNGGYYSYNTSGTRYDRVANGTGHYTIALSNDANTSMDANYNNGYNDNIFKKNVNAYFVYGKPTGVTLLNNNTYSPISVTKNPTHTGDYDYNVANKTFSLNKGNGKYDVLFKSDGAGLYYIMASNFQIVDEGTGTYSFPIKYVAQANGNYEMRTGVPYMSFDQYNGKYRFVKATTGRNNYDQDVNAGTITKVYVQNHEVLVPMQFHFKVQLINNEWFKTKTLGVPADQVDNYPVEIITTTPEDLTADIINKADLFYINTKEHNSSYMSLYESFNDVGRSLPASERYSVPFVGTAGTKDKAANLNFAKHDLSWDNVMLIFKRAAGIGCNKAAMIIDDTFYQDATGGAVAAYQPLYKAVTVPSPTFSGNGATMCNLAKLYIMVYQRNMIDFYNAFIQPSNASIKPIKQVTMTVSGTSKPTGSYVRPDMSIADTADAAVYWNGNTFLPYGLMPDGTLGKYVTGNTQTDLNTLVAKGLSNYNITATNTDLTNNVLTLDGREIFSSQGFNQYISLPDNSPEQDEAETHLSQLNGGALVNPTSITLGNLINVVTNNGTGYEDVGAVAYPQGSNVEGPPADTPAQDAGDTMDDGNDGSGLRGYKRVLNIEPTADFSTSEAAIKTILSNYDVQIVDMTSMQFNSSIEDINTKYDMIYMGSSYGRFNLTSGNTVFNSNTNTPNGSYYFATGDTRVIKLPGKDTQYYRGNDITTQKKSDLDAYLNAGYPIVLDSKLYAATDSVPDIKNSVNLKALVYNSKTKNNFLNGADNSSTNATTRQTFKAKLNTALDVVRPIISLITPQIPDDYNYVDPATKLLTIQFKLLPKGTFPSTYTYDAYLFLDSNGDGIFDASEQLSVVSSDGSSTTGLSESSSKTYTYNYSMSGYNGEYQWKLEIRRHDNNNIHSSIIGYTSNTNKEDIYILQIIANTGTTYSLQSKINDAASLVYKYAGGNALKDFALHITTMTQTQFEQLYATQPYTTATAATTNKLAGYHILFMDIPVAAITANNGARTNIYDEVAKNLSVIYTFDALSYDNQGYYNASAKSSFENFYTYNFLNENAFKPTSSYYIYNSLTTNGDLTNLPAYKTTYLTKTNEGTITRYPYQIDPAIKSAANYFSDNVAMDMNLSSKRLIGWYCLSDTKDPSIRAKFNTGVADTDLYKGLYSSSPNEVKNNYYLFSNGLCYYSGITLATADVTGNDNEIKLFVNTIISAYKATTRIVYTPPVITITNPVPDANNTVNFDDTNIVNNNLILTFNLKCTSKMSLSVKINGAEASGSWDDTIYKVIGTSQGPPITIDTGNKDIVADTYVLNIPVSALIPNNGSNKLTFTAVNEGSQSVTKDFTLVYTQKPVVNITNPVPDASNTINIDDTNIVNNNFILTFSLVCTNKMSLSVQVNGAEASGSWDDTIYKVIGASYGPAIPIDTGNKDIVADTYVLIIPVSALILNNGSNKLTFTAVNEISLSATKDVTLVYNQKPVVNITNPVPDASNTINIDDTNIVNNNFILTFNLVCTNKMSLSVRVNGTEASGSWDDTIYKVIGASYGPAIPIDTGNKDIVADTYVLIIPVSALILNNGSNKLTFTAVNVGALSATKDVTLVYSPKPVVTITNPAPVDPTNGFLYADIDYNAVDTDESYLKTAPPMVVTFQVDKSVTNFTLSLTSTVDADTTVVTLTDSDVTIKNESGTVISILQSQTNGLRTYTMYIPVALMKDHNSRVLYIKATDTAGRSGQASITLLRRSLFPLD